MHRRGSTFSSLLIALGIVGGFALTAVIVVPLTIQADTTADVQIQNARLPENQQILDRLAAMLGHSPEILAVYPRGESPFLEVVLRLDGAGDAGEAISEIELGILSHSRVMQTVTLYTLNSEAGNVDREPAARRLKRSEIHAKSFRDWWRQRPEVKPRILARGISDMHVELVSHDDEGAALLRISLTWAAHSSDVDDEASALVHVAMRRPGPLRE